MVGLFGKFVFFGVTLLTVLSMVACGGGDSDGSPPETAVESRTWYHPESLTDNISPDGQDAQNVQAVMDNDGNAIIVWEQSDGTVRQIFKSEYRNGSWTHPVSLADNISPDGQEAYSPQVAMDDNGNAVIAWFQSNGVNYQIFKSEYRNGSWTHPTALADKISPDGQAAYYPQVAMDENGNAVIVWYQYDGVNYQIFKSEYRNGSWTHPTALTDNISPDGEDAYNHHVAMDNGNAIIVWQQYDGSDTQIFKSEYRSGSWTHPASLADNISPDGAGADGSQVEIDNNGNAVIAWAQNDGSVWQIFKSEYRGGAWTHPADLTDNISPDGHNAYSRPDIAMDDNGNAIIVWWQHDGAKYLIFKSEYRNGAWAHPADLTDKISLDGLSARAPKTAMDNNGNAIIVWEHDGIAGITAESIFKSEYRNGSWTHPADFDDRLNADGASASALVPVTAMGDSGNAIIVWRQYLGKGGHGIFKSEYR